MKIFILIFLVLFSLNLKTYSQKKDLDKENKSEAFAVVDHKPEFPGGEEALMEFIRTNIKYPESALDSGVEGKVLVRFIIGDSGKVTNVEVVKKVASDLDAEALRVVSMLPDWTPGIQNGENVSVVNIIPITFKLYTHKDKKINYSSALYADVVNMNLEIKPEYPGGEEAIDKFIKENIQYPALALDFDIEGTVIVGFLIDQNGKMLSQRIVESNAPILNSEAIRVVSLLEGWKPTEQNNEKFTSYKEITVKFIIPKK